MPTAVPAVAQKYLRARDPAQWTCRACRTIGKKSLACDIDKPLAKLDRPTLRNFVGWVHEEASADGSSNPTGAALPRQTPKKTAILAEGGTECGDMPPILLPWWQRGLV